MSPADCGRRRPGGGAPERRRRRGRRQPLAGGRVAEGGDVLVGEELIARADQGRAQLRAWLADRAVEHSLERARGPQELGGGLLPDPLGAWDPIRGIAAQGDEVGDELGRYPVA